MANFKRCSSPPTRKRSFFPRPPSQEVLDCFSEGIFPPIPEEKSIGLSVETHFYDGKLLERIELYPMLRRKWSTKKIRRVTSDFTEKSEFLDHSEYFYKIVRGDKENYDPTNKVDALDILCSIHDIYLIQDLEEQKNTIKLLELQFQDMSTGFCSQGRCTRLLQVFFGLH